MTDLLLERLSEQEFDQVLRYLNSFFNRHGVRVIFRTHFKDRVNDERNENPITRETFLEMMNRLLKDVNYRKLKSMRPGQEGIMVYKTTNFAYTLDIVGREVQLRFITAMDKSRSRSNSKDDFILKLESFRHWFSLYESDKRKDLSKDGS